MRVFFSGQIKNLVFLATIATLSLFSFVSVHAQQETVLDKIFSDTTTKQKIRVAVMPLYYGKGMSENTSLIFSNDFASSVSHFDRFEIITPDQIVAFLSEVNPSLLNCKTIICGTTIAKMFDSRYFIIGEITPRRDNFDFIVNVIDIDTGKKIYSEQANFPEKTIYNHFYKIAANVNEHIPVTGKVMGAGKKRVILNMGRNDGIKLTDKVVIHDREALDFYKPSRQQKTGITNLNNAQEPIVENDELGNDDDGEELTLSESESSDIVFDRISAVKTIINITRVNPEMSEGFVWITKTPEEPAKEHDKAVFLINRIRQVEFIRNARLEIDRYYGSEEKKIDTTKKIRKKIPEKKVPPPIIVPIPLPIVERNEWIHKVRHWESERDFFQKLLIGSIAVTAYALYSEKSFSVVHLAPAGAVIYSTYALLYSRKELNELIEEGKYKGYIRTQGDSFFNPQKYDKNYKGATFGITYNIDF